MGTLANLPQKEKIEKIKGGVLKTMIVFRTTLRKKKNLLKY